MLSRALVSKLPMVVPDVKEVTSIPKLDLVVNLYSQGCFMFSHLGVDATF